MRSVQEVSRYSFINLYAKAEVSLSTWSRNLVGTTSENRMLMIANVHLEPGSNLRDLRERLHAIHKHWPQCPTGAGFLIGDFNICEPEEGRFIVVTQTFSDDLGRTAAFRSIFPRAFEISPPGFYEESGS